jgi:hypothetical protein
MLSIHIPNSKLSGTSSTRTATMPLNASPNVTSPIDDFPSGSLASGVYSTSRAPLTSPPAPKAVKRMRHAAATNAGVAIVAAAHETYSSWRLKYLYGQPTYWTVKFAGWSVGGMRVRLAVSWIAELVAAMMAPEAGWTPPNTGESPFRAAQELNFMELSMSMGVVTVKGLALTLSNWDWISLVNMRRGGDGTDVDGGDDTEGGLSHEGEVEVVLETHCGEFGCLVRVL